MFSNTTPVDHTSLRSYFPFSLLKLQIAIPIRHKCIVLVTVNFSQVLDLLAYTLTPSKPQYCEYLCTGLSPSLYSLVFFKPG